jgi:hypothetical protein
LKVATLATEWLVEAHARIIFRNPNGVAIAMFRQEVGFVSGGPFQQMQK